jgi:SHS2 domain-containing protein
MYRFLDNITTADVAFEAEADNLPQLFQESAEALFSTMADLSAVQPSERRTIRLSAKTLDKLLFDWLSELVFLKDKDYFLFSEFSVDIQEGQPYNLVAKAWGEKIDPPKHHVKVDVKAVTYHKFYVKQTNGLWRARVVLDI